MEEVELFLTAHNIDPSAGKELRSEPPHVALAVLERGPLRACTNPSGALVARIRDAKRGILSGGAAQGVRILPPATPVDPNAPEAERFLQENRIDVAAAASFRAETLDIQKLILSKGPLTNSTNPSASLMARIRNCKANVAQGGGLPGMGPLPPGALPPGQVTPGGPLPLMSGLVTGGGAAPPPPGPPPGPPPRPPPLQLEDNRAQGAIGAAIEDDIQKAISKLKMAAAQPGPQPPGMVSSGGPASPGGRFASSPPARIDGGQQLSEVDKALQMEALKAIQALNNQP